MQTFSSVLLFLGFAIAASTQEAAEAPKINKRFNGGWCGVHVHTFDGENAKGSHEMNVWVYDGKQQLIWSKESIWGDGQLMAESEGLPLVLNINTHGSGDDVATFTYGDDAWGSGKWDSNNGRCSVGKQDSPSLTSSTVTVDLDCGFSC
ncbi:hypothetical protein NCS57_01316700 [Fusarium keratoplasticum]|uniref:Uncharacterized protein n=1 Tax=Fusarium keratoplasticum TaxID=1328300 RepID=A0ACC0QGC1_9HYPO|nr:hypothetical protein NCS57_01316700 [Fusarium keratoplasticum]KAI8652525.1 hypothetical protein NCS57_01316700 [Fusarium keratoplasticum]KAI8653254.1 hypothetical protein NCS55_01310400 [Fusarium keratoplasticum]